jgi:HSP20 family protein
MLIRRRPTVFERFFEDVNRSVSETENSIRLALDVHETEDAYIVAANVPGVLVDDIDIRLHDNVLSISAETVYENEEEQRRALIQERTYGKFNRSLRFPVPVNNEAIEADYGDGVLTVTIPKSEEVKPRRIEVKSAN